MPIGDDAAAAGLAVFPETQDLRKGYQNDNQRGDEIAAEMAARAAGDKTLRDTLTGIGFTKSVCFAGDSLTAYAGMVAPNYTVDAGGFMPWACAMAGYGFEPIQKGIGGNTSAMLLARMADILATKADVYHILIGTNDARNAVPLGTTMANIEAILAMLRVTGRPVILGTLPPQSGWTATVQTAHDSINRQIRRISYPNVHIADYESSFIDPANGSAIAGFLSDGLHTTVAGAFKMGATVAPLLESLVAQSAPLPASSNAAYVPNSRFASRQANGMPTGVVAFTGPGHVTHSSVPRVGQAGGWWQMVKTGAPNLSVHAYEWPNGIGVGAKVRLACEFEFLDIVGGSAGAMSGISLYTLNAAKEQIAEASFLNGELFQRTPNGSYSGVMITPPLTITAATAYLRFGMVTAMNGTYRFDKMHLFTVA